MVTAINQVAIFLLGQPFSANLQRLSDHSIFATTLPSCIRALSYMDAVLKRNKAKGKSHKVQHKDAITDADKDRPAEYFKDVLDYQET